MVIALQGCGALVVKMAGKHLKEDFKTAKLPLFKTTETQLLCIANSFAKNQKAT